MVTPLLQYQNLKICINILEIGVLHAFTKKVLNDFENLEGIR